MWQFYIGADIFQRTQLYHYFLFIKAESRASIWRLYAGSSLLVYVGLLAECVYKENAVLSKISHNFNLLIFCLFIQPGLSSISEISYICAVLSFLWKVQQFQSIIVLNWENSIFSNVLTFNSALNACAFLHYLKHLENELISTHLFPTPIPFHNPSYLPHFCT